MACLQCVALGPQVVGQGDVHNEMLDDACLPFVLMHLRPAELCAEIERCSTMVWCKEEEEEEGERES